jgi:UDP-N-acetylmuramoylalanine--D-glutamate ligase
MIRCTTFAGRTVAVFGLGASGNATARSLMEGGATVAAWDDSESSRSASAALGIPIVDLAAADWSSFAALVLAPGVPLTHPEPHWTVRRASAAGIEIIGDIELFFRERDKVCPVARVIAITGTNGKSTTTALTAHVLQAAGIRVEMGGNIGRPVLDLAPPAPDIVYVLELSSFQIDLAPSIRCTVAALLNITPDHIDRHGTVEHYAAVKARIFAAMGKDFGVPVIGLFDPLCRALARRLQEKEELPVVTISGPGDDSGTFFCEAARVVWRDQELGETREIARLDGIGSLRGAHNWQNATAALALANALVARTHLDGPDNPLAGIGSPPQLMERAVAALAAFPGLPHRMEEIGRVGRVLFINDSKATNADSAGKALASFEGDIFWILGGKPKEGGIASLERYYPRIAKAYLIGQAATEFALALDGKVPYEHCHVIGAALAAAARDASASPGAEPVVLLSPACASYDQFKSFEHRGDTFRALVAALPGVVLRGAT